MNAKTEVKQQLENRKQAVISQNIKQIIGCYADDVRAFDAIAELQFTPRSNYQTYWQSCLEMCKMTKFEIGQLDIKAAGDLAACCFLNQCGSIDEKTGEEQTGWVRATQISQKRDGK